LFFRGEFEGISDTSVGKDCHKSLSDVLLE